jgi:hypothetical protein
MDTFREYFLDVVERELFWGHDTQGNFPVHTQLFGSSQADSKKGLKISEDISSDLEVTLRFFFFPSQSFYKENTKKVDKLELRIVEQADAGNSCSPRERTSPADGTASKPNERRKPARRPETPL